MPGFLLRAGPGCACQQGRSGILVNFLILLVICVVCVVVCQMVRPYVTGKRSVAEIDKEIKQYYYEQYRRDGKIEL